MRVPNVTSSLAIALLIIPVYLDAQYRDIDSLASSLGQSLSLNAPNKTVAVVDFTDLRGNVTELGRFLAEELSVSLVSSSARVRVIDSHSPEGLAAGT